MKPSSQGARRAPNVADSPPTNNHDADRDYEGLCIQCLERNAVQILERIDGSVIACDSFCSRQCGLEFAIQITSNQDDDICPNAKWCEHGVDTLATCSRCDQYLIRLNGRRKKGGGR